MPHRFRPRIGRPVDAERGTLVVPENRERAGSNPIALAFVRFPATTPDPGHPIVFLAGGPGESGIETARGGHFPLFMALRRFSDVIALDQRGTAASTPTLRCETGGWRFPLERPADRGEFLALALERSRACAARLRSRGIDLTGYNTVQSADDIDDLRAALGAEKLNLWGMSYGTHLAFTVLKRHGGCIDRCVLGGAEGPDHTYKLPSVVQRQLDRIGERVREHRAWGNRMPDFVATVRTVLERLQNDPVGIDVPDPVSGERLTLGLGRFDVEYATSVGLADTRLLSLLPAWYHGMSCGDFSLPSRRPLLARYLSLLKRGLGANAMSLLMDCASGVTGARWRRIETEARETVLGRTIDFPFPEVGDAWGSPDLGDEFRSPVHADNPVLFLSGSLDCRTPLENILEVQEGLPRSETIVIEDAGHMDVFLSCPDVAPTMSSFFRGEPDDAARPRQTVSRSASPFDFELW